MFPSVLLNYWFSNDPYIMSYFHPRDFDPEQPMIPGLRGFRKFQSYVGLSGALGKLDQWLRGADFMDVAEAEQRISWEKMPVISL